MARRAPRRAGAARGERGVRRTHPRLHAEGDQGGEGAYELGERESAVRKGARRLRRHHAARRTPRRRSSRRSCRSSVRSRGSARSIRCHSSSCSMTSPGVVDFYQGNELWDFHLVDPDNRQPVDFAAAPGAARRIDRGAARISTRCSRMARRPHQDVSRGHAAAAAARDAGAVAGRRVSAACAAAMRRAIVTSSRSRASTARAPPSWSCRDSCTS